MASKRKSDPPGGTGAWQPRALFLLIIAALLVLGVAELLNLLRHPSMLRLSGPANARRVTIYQKGRAANREAWLLAEPEGERGPAVCFQHIDCTGDDRTTGDLRWSGDGHLLYATQRKASSIDEGDQPLWVYDFPEQTLWSLDPRPLGKGLPMKSATGSQLAQLIATHGRKGEVAVSWYDLGKRGDYLFAWQITRWEKALPEK